MLLVLPILPEVRAAAESDMDSVGCNSHACCGAGSRWVMQPLGDSRVST